MDREFGKNGPKKIVPIHVKYIACQPESPPRTFFFIKFLVFSLKKKSHLVILSFIYADIHIQTPTNVNHWNTCLQTKNIGLGEIRNHKALVTSVVCPAGLFMLNI